MAKHHRRETHPPRSAPTGLRAGSGATPSASRRADVWKLRDAAKDAVAGDEATAAGVATRATVRRSIVLEAIGVKEGVAVKIRCRRTRRESATRREETSKRGGGGEIRVGARRTMAVRRGGWRSRVVVGRSIVSSRLGCSGSEFGSASPFSDALVVFRQRVACCAVQ